MYPNRDPRLLPLGLSLLLVGCFQGPGFFDQEGSQDATAVISVIEKDGATTGKVSSGSNVTQKLAASDSSGVSGSAASFPPGSLTIDSDVTLEESAAFADSSTAEELGISGGDLSAASNALVVSSSVPQDAASPFTLEIPVSSGLVGFGLNERKLIVVYKVYKASEGNRLVTGVIPPDKVKQVDGKAQFQTRHFGAFQLAYTSAEIKEEIQKDATTPILSKREEEKLPPITWSQVDTSYDQARRSASFSATVSGMDQIEGCLLAVDQDRATPFDKTFKMASPERKHVLAVTDKEHTLYARYICKDSHGRTARSDWSNGVTVKPLIAQISENSGSYSISGDGVVAYVFGFSRSSSCDGISYSAVRSTNERISENFSHDGYLCVRAIDKAGNRQSVASTKSVTVQSSGDDGSTTTPIALQITGQLSRNNAPYISISDTTDRFFVDNESTSFVLEGSCDSNKGNVLVSGQILSSTNVGHFSLPCNSNSFYQVIKSNGSAGEVRLDISTTYGGLGIRVEQGSAEDFTFVHRARPATTTTHVVTVNDPTMLHTALSAALSGDQQLNYVLITSDLDLSSVGDWTVIADGGSGSSFQGILDGDGHMISNLSVSSPTSGQVGMFGQISGAIISNLILDSVNINAGDYNYVGSIAGKGLSASTLRNVKVSNATVTGTFYIGGVIGYATDVSIKNCDVKNSSIAGQEHVGGVVGYLSGSTSALIRSRAYGMTVEGQGAPANTNGIGGLIGTSQMVTSLEEIGCNTCILKAAADPEFNVGGVIGYMDIYSATSAITISNLYAQNLTFTTGAGNSVSGLIGRVYTGAHTFTIQEAVVANASSGYPTAAAGPLIGPTSGGGTVSATASFYDQNIGCYDVTHCVGTSSTDTSLKSMTLYSGAGWAITSPSSTVGTSTWLIHDGSSYPYFIWE